MTLKNHNLANKVPGAIEDRLAGLDDAELLSLRRKIDIQLSTDLTKLDLGEELGLQYRQGMIMLDSFSKDDSAPLNHRATALTSVSNVLSKIIREQQTVYSAERLKRYEAAFMKVLQSLPPEQTRIYFDLYCDFLKEDVPRETVA